DKLLAVPADCRETGKRFESAVPELLEVQPSEKHGTLRRVNGSLEELEALARQQAENMSDEHSFKSTLEDLVYLAWRRENRKRIVLFLASLMQSCVQASRTAAGEVICQLLRSVSWASSMVDIEFYSPKTSQSPLVLLCGFGGSHLDDLQPAIDHWTGHGAAVLAFGPALLGREEMLDVIQGKLLQLAEEPARPVIFHCFSDGGFVMARCVLGLWDRTWSSGKTTISPLDRVKCLIMDSAGLLPQELAMQDTDLEPVVPRENEEQARRGRGEAARLRDATPGLKRLAVDHLNGKTVSQRRWSFKISHLV
ncbi:unnamed protein product, partial [Effrenium voratum]